MKFLFHQIFSMFSNVHLWHQNKPLVAWLTQSSGVPGSSPAAPDIFGAHICSDPNCLKSWETYGNVRLIRAVRTFLPCIFSGFARCIVAAHNILHLFSKQFPCSKQLATLAKQSPNVCQTISKQYPYRRLVIAEFAIYLPILSVVLFCQLFRN